MNAPSRPWRRMLGWGAASTACYAVLFANETAVMAAFTRTDGWYPALPVLTAFVFSLVHGAFTGYFWEVVGIVARPAPKEVVAQEVEE